MRRRPLTAMLTVMAALATTLAVAGCGSKGGSPTAKPATSGAPATTTTTTKHKSKPAY
jgi:hypothetical protein